MSGTKNSMQTCSHFTKPNPLRRMSGSENPQLGELSPPAASQVAPWTWLLYPLNVQFICISKASFISVELSSPTSHGVA